jgi:hypothetical protein
VKNAVAAGQGRQQTILGLKHVLSDTGPAGQLRQSLETERESIRILEYLYFAGFDDRLPQPVVNAA